MKQNPTVRFIQFERPNGIYKTMHTVRDLAECLLHDFPLTGRGKSYKSAVNACLECLLDGGSSGEEVRSYFVAAAHEVALFVRPDDITASRSDHF